ncbi:hypothetical protein ANO11243_074390 [Dothideomycetidae sp. 11243]|nr:hypothetical protein ANO11243_074390 [fungal sp. No.11243]
MALSTGAQWAAATPALIFGFAPNQVHPFTLPTPDGEKLYAWHVLPLDVYAKHRTALQQDPNLPLCLLRTDPKAKVAVVLHGNAGHVAQAWRTDTYRSFTSIAHTHVLAIDYRGFGKSTGSPSEAGLITDGIAAVQHVLSNWGVPPERIAIVGHSLGTAVASAVTMYFADQSSSLIPNATVADSSPTSKPAQEAIHFAGTLLISPFISLPSLLLDYSIGGVLPLLFPLRHLRFAHPLLAKVMHSPWPTALRLKAYFASSTSPSSSPSSSSSTSTHRAVKGTVHILHALDDREIPPRQSEGLYAALTGRSVPWPDVGTKRPLRAEHVFADRKLVVEFVGKGGHDRVCTYSGPNLALRDMFGLGQSDADM